jgi:hypothetical protein
MRGRAFVISSDSSDALNWPRISKGPAGLPKLGDERFGKLEAALAVVAAHIGETPGRTAWGFLLSGRCRAQPSRVIERIAPMKPPVASWVLCQVSPVSGRVPYILK